MLRVLAIAAMFALALPTLATAQDDHRDDHGRPPHAGGPPHAPPHPGGPPPHGVPHGPPGGPMGHPMGPGPMVHGGPGGQFSYRGHMIGRIHVDPFRYPPGFAYRRWAVGAALPPIFLAREYWYADWAGLGMAPPPPGFQWVRYGPDLLLVNVITGQVADVAYDVFY
jgi:Ni/Co efflux regulator RcnB